MSVFTRRLKDVIDDLDGDIGLGAYPIFDEGYRVSLNQKIIDHYWNQEIGLETQELFRFNLRRKMAEIMPLYNKLYESEKIKFDPLSTMDIESVANNESITQGTAAGTSNTAGTNAAKAIGVTSSFPQTALDENDTGNYADGSNETSSEGNSTGTASENRNESGKANDSSKSTSKGYTGPAADLLMRYRESLLNLDMNIIRDLQELFMSVWDTGDTYTESGYYR